MGLDIDEIQIVDTSIDDAKSKIITDYEYTRNL